MWDGLPRSQPNTVEGMFKGCSFDMAKVRARADGVSPSKARSQYCFGHRVAIGLPCHRLALP